MKISGKIQICVVKIIMFFYIKFLNRYINRGGLFRKLQMNRENEYTHYTTRNDNKTSQWKLKNKNKITLLMRTKLTSYSRETLAYTLTKCINRHRHISVSNSCVILFANTIMQTRFVPRLLIYAIFTMYHARQPCPFNN